MADVSIFVSYYNGIRYLPTFLENYREQTIFDRLEMIFTACLLSNEEQELIKNFQEKYPGRIKVIHFNELKPQSVCWNISIKESTANLVCEWNVDDIRTPDSIERQYNLFKSNPSLDVVTGNFLISKSYPKHEGEYIEHRFNTRAVWQDSMLLGPFFMFKKSLCEEIGYFDEQLKSAADYDFSVRLLSKAKIGFTKYLLGYFLDEGRGLSTGNNILQPLERTVVELRYGFYNKIDTRFTEMAKKYDIEHIHQGDEKILASNFVLNFSEEII